MEEKMEENMEDFINYMSYDNFRESMDKAKDKAMDKMIKQNDYYNEQHNTGPEPFTASQPCQYLSLDSSNAFTLGVSETIITNFSDTLTTFSEEERIKELTKHINN